MCAVQSLADLNRLNREVWAVHSAAFTKSLLNQFVARHAESEMKAAHRALLTIQDPAAHFEAFQKIPNYEAVVAESDKKLASHFADEHNVNQQAIAKKLRKPPLFDGRGMAELVDVFLSEQEEPDVKSEALWPKFVEELGKRGLEPIAINGKDAYKYWPFGKTDKISFGYFRNLISKSRKKAAR